MALMSTEINSECALRCDITSSVQMNLNDLPDDCLFLILQQLQWRDQLSAAETCRRLHDLLSILWQRKYRKFLMDCTFSCKAIALIMESICSKVQELEILRIDSWTHAKWDIIKLHFYPNLKCLTLGNHKDISDECILKMTEIFPNLRSFAIMFPQISGRYIVNWLHLEDLDLSSCEKVEFRHVERILEALRLKTLKFLRLKDKQWTSVLAFNRFCELERIGLGSRELSLILDISLLSNLKEFSFLDIDEKLPCRHAIEDFLQHKHNDIILIFVSCFFPVYLLCVRQYDNLNKFEACDMDVTGWFAISKFAPNLREINVTNCYGLKEEYIHLWVNSTQIELIAVVHCFCEFNELRVNVKDITKHRTSLLHLYFHLNRSPLRLFIKLHQQGESPLFKVTRNRFRYPYGYFLYKFGFRR